jgi:hypothetical protein
MADFPLAALAGFVRAQLAAVGDLMRGREAAPLDRTVEAGRAATVIVAASSTFAVTAQARARLLRQLHASGLLSAREADQADELLRRRAG